MHKIDFSLSLSMYNKINDYASNTTNSMLKSQKVCSHASLSYGKAVSDTTVRPNYLPPYCFYFIKNCKTLMRDRTLNNLTLHAVHGAHRKCLYLFKVVKKHSLTWKKMSETKRCFGEIAVKSDFQISMTICVTV